MDKTLESMFMNKETYNEVIEEMLNNRKLNHMLKSDLHLTEDEEDEIMEQAYKYLGKHEIDYFNKCWDKYIEYGFIHSRAEGYFKAQTIGALGVFRYLKKMN